MKPFTLEALEAAAREKQQLTLAPPTEIVAASDKPLAGQNSDLLGTYVEGERNDALFRYGCSLQARGYPDAEIEELLIERNATGCQPPLEEREFSRLLTHVLEDYPKGQSFSEDTVSTEDSANKEKKAFNHADFGDALIERDRMCFVDGMPMIWDGTHYLVGREKLLGVMIERNRIIKSSQRTEVWEYLRLKAPKVSMGASSNIVFANGVLDLKTLRFYPNSPDYRIPNVIPHRWNPEAYCPELDKSLDEWACHDEAIRKNLEETIGLCIYRGSEVSSCPILIGEGSNGKSTFLRLLHEILGDDNTSSMDIADIGKRFQSVALMGKLANIGDDISSGYLDARLLATVKKVITNDWVGAEYKGGNTFQFKPYCTLVFSCNRMPRLGDTSKGMYRRLVPIPFNASFSIEKGNLNPALGSKLSSESAYERAIYLGVMALKECLERGAMYQTQTQQELLNSIKMNDSSVYAFCQEELGFGDSGAPSIEGKSTRALYDQYREYCEKTGCKALSRNPFTTEMNQLYGTKTMKKRNGKEQCRVFCSARDPRPSDVSGK